MNISVNPVLTVEASTPDKEPLAQQTFYILEKSPISILRANDPKSEISYARTMDALRNLSVGFFITDSRGRAEVKKLKTGSYYICGISYTAQEAKVWNVEIELLPGKNYLKL